MADVRRTCRALGASVLAVAMAGVGGLTLAGSTAAASSRALPAVGTAAGSAFLHSLSAPASFTQGRAGGHAAAAPSWVAHHAPTAATLYVSPTGTDMLTGTPNTCTDKASPCKTIGHALAEAATSTFDNIELAPGTYKEATNPTHLPNVIPDSMHFFDLIQLTETLTHPWETDTQVVITAAGFTYGVEDNATETYIADLTVTNARRSGIYATPTTTTTKGASIYTLYLAGLDVVGNDTCATSATVATATTAACATPTPESDYGEGIHLESVQYSTIYTNYVAHNWGGILVTDEHGPSAHITIDYNTSVTNAGDCGITLAGHNTAAVETSGPTAGKPTGTTAGVYTIDVYHNFVSQNGAAGIIDAGGPPGAGVYNNGIFDNVAVGDGLAGISIHSHAPLQDMDTVVIAYNRTVHDAIHGGPDGGPGDVEGPPASADMMQGAGIQVLAAVVPVKTTVIATNVIATDFYGIWMSPGVEQAAEYIGTNEISVTTGGTAVFAEPAPDTGYVMAGSDGGAFTFGTLGYEGSVPGTGHPASAPVVGVAETPDGGGYWEATAAGQVYAFGDATSFGTLLTEGGTVSDVVGIAATATGGGYWLAEADGAVHAYGDAVSYGTLPADHVSVSNVVGIAATATGAGYWLVGDDGGVFAFGSASYEGSVPGDGIAITNVKGIAPAPGGQGYWLVGDDGGVFAFGAATFYGSLPGDHVSVDNVVGIEAAPTGRGYWMVGDDGGVFAFGSALYTGSVPGVGVHVSDVVGLTSNPI